VVLILKDAINLKFTRLKEISHKANQFYLFSWWNEI